MTRSSLDYVDRRTGQVVSDPIYAPRFLNWSYNTLIGWGATKFFFSRPIVSRIYGWFHRQPWSQRKVKPFAERLRVNLDECLQPLEAFRSLNDFVVREIDLSRRPIDPDPAVCVSPVDGRVQAYPEIDADATFAIKRASFNLRRFIGNDDLARDYAGGALWIGRLYLADYHHFHFPADGWTGPSAVIPGRCFAVTPYARRRLVPFFDENKRVLTPFDSDRFGRILMIEVGAFTIGSIQQRYHTGVRVAKGDHKGFFQLGGSIVALVFPPGTILFDHDLCDNTQRGLETLVRFGESIGRARTP